MGGACLFTFSWSLFASGPFANGKPSCGVVYYRGTSLIRNRDSENARLPFLNYPEAQCRNVASCVPTSPPSPMCPMPLSKKKKKERGENVFTCEEALPNPRYLLSGQDRSRKWPHDEPPRRSAAPQGGQLLPEARRSTPKRGVSIGGGFRRFRAGSWRGTFCEQNAPLSKFVPTPATATCFQQ